MKPPNYSPASSLAWASALLEPHHPVELQRFVRHFDSLSVVEKLDTAGLANHIRKALRLVADCTIRPSDDLLEDCWEELASAAKVIFPEIGSSDNVGLRSGSGEGSTIKEPDRLGPVDFELNVAWLLILGWSRSAGKQPEKLDFASEFAAFFEKMAKRSNPSGGMKPPGEYLAGLIERVHVLGTDSINSDESRFLAKHFSEQQKKTKKAEAAATLERLAYELFPELKPDQTVTANRLTKCFAKRANPTDGTRPKSVDDETKLKFVQLTRAWKEVGGSLEYEGQSVRLDTTKHTADTQDKTFVVLEAKKGFKPVKRSVYVPGLIFNS
ncbi:hypothetical protein [Rhodopirellula bahusiensis]|nr:hypothetical protein [Rhodopirellula bahusiensis]